MANPITLLGQGFPQRGSRFVEDTGRLLSPWYQLLANLWQAAIRPGPQQIQTISGNPFVFTAIVNGTMFLDQALALEVSRDGVNWFTVLVTGAVPMLAGDSLRISWAVAPVAVFFPSGAST
jgi:hypothetical protein